MFVNGKHKSGFVVLANTAVALGSNSDALHRGDTLSRVIIPFAAVVYFRFSM